MSLKLPHKIKLNSKVSYKIKFVPSFDCEKTLGECNPNTKEITIKMGLPDDLTMSVATHECYHALSFEQLDLCLVERQVEILEIELVKLFRRNPKFFDLFIDLVKNKL